MKTPLVLTILAAALVAPGAFGGSTSTVALEVTLGDASAPAYKACQIEVATPTTGAAVLDAAVASGCLDSWNYDTYPGFGRYVTCIDGVCSVFGTYWGFEINGETAQGGVDNTNGAATINSGDHVEFVYDQWLTFLAPL